MMDKTININLAGTLFQIDEEAYRILRDYLQAINNRFRNVQGGNETIEDIESRIAEIFQSQKGLAGAISKENVEAMISIIGKPEDFELNEDETYPPINSSHRKKLYRNRDDCIISGVCSGIGAYTNTDPVLFRILFILFTLFFGVGFFVYIALWIALPAADTEAKRREMYGNAYHSVNSRRNQSDGASASSAPLYNQGYYNTSRVGNAFNEVFRALGKVCYIILRILLIIIGVTFVLTGFLFILSFVMIFLFKYPGAFSIDSSGVDLTYFPDFLNYIVNPATVPWIIILTSVAFILPMLALIYWGVKMIFLFKARDGIFSLAGLVLWVMTLAVLSIILFREGISFTESATTSSQYILPGRPDTLYIRTDLKVADLKFEKEVSIPHDEYTVFINEEKKELYIRPYLNVNSSDDDVARVELWKRSSGRSKMDARKKSEELLYSYHINGDTLYLDEYFTIPSERKWSADNVGINLYIHEGTILKFDIVSENLLNSHTGFGDEDYYDYTGSESGNRSLIMTEEGLKAVSKQSVKQK